MKQYQIRKIFYSALNNNAKIPCALELYKPRLHVVVVSILVVQQRIHGVVAFSCAHTISR